MAITLSLEALLLLAAAVVDMKHLVLQMEWACQEVQLAAVLTAAQRTTLAVKEFQVKVMLEAVIRLALLIHLAVAVVLELLVQKP